MNDSVQNLLDLAKQIRFVKLDFDIQFSESGNLPHYKSSALRGGMGDMLMELFCVRDKMCEKCDFEDICAFQRVMYPTYDIVPSFTSGKDRIGYLIDCENHCEYANQGDRLTFSVKLFGKTIVEWRQVIQAFDKLGRVGVGENRVRYRLIRVKSLDGTIFDEDRKIDREKLKIQQVRDYVDSRHSSREKRLLLQTPVEIRYKGKKMRHFEPEAVMPALARRIFMYSCFEGIECQEIKLSPAELPQLSGEHSYWGRVKRYSSHTGEVMTFKGIVGYADLENISDECREMILMGELFGVGRNTKFGLGKIRLIEASRKENR